jgi:predicted DNA-binding protein with PD1-like motif
MLRSSFESFFIWYHNNMKLYTLRPKLQQDLRVELLKFAKTNNIAGGSIVSCVGALKPFLLRMAGAKPDSQDIRKYEDTHEIISPVGTLTFGVLSIILYKHPCGA